MQLIMLKATNILAGNLYSTLEACNHIHCTLNNISCCGYVHISISCIVIWGLPFHFITLCGEYVAYPNYQLCCTYVLACIQIMVKYHVVTFCLIVSHMKHV